MSTSGAEKPAADWTEFGATEEAWKSAHEPDTRYAEGCCYLSGPLSAEGRYAGINTDDYKGVSRVDSFELFFDPPVSVALAREVVRAEAPPQSRLVFAIKKGDCLLINYRSPALTRAFGSKSAVMSAGLYSSAGGPFNGRTVDDIIFLPVGGRSLGC